MVIDFFITKPDAYTILVLENSNPLVVDYSNPLEEITSMTLDISVGSELFEGIDCLPYILTHGTDTEIYAITSDDLGLGEGEVIPDGVYTLTWTINNVNQVTNTFIVYENIKAEVDAKLEELGYSIQVDTFDARVPNDTCTSGNIEQLRLASVLIDVLKTAGSTGDTTLAEKTLVDLNNLLLIINNEII